MQMILLKAGMMKTKNAWSVMVMERNARLLMLKGIESNVHADVNNVVRSYEDKIREIIDTADISVSDDLVELMLTILSDYQNTAS